VAGHAPFCWAANAMEAAHTAVILQYLAKIVLYTVVMASSSQPISRKLHDKHYFA
jgi:L-ribulose-5-phosphate 4-epimerase